MGLLSIETREAARRMAARGSIGCLFAAGYKIVFTGFAMYQGELVQGPLLTAASLLPELLVMLVAAWRLLGGKGLVWGSAALLLFASYTVAEIIVVTDIGTLSFPKLGFNLIVLGLIANGVRGAWALRRDRWDIDDSAEASAA